MLVFTGQLHIIGQVADVVGAQAIVGDPCGVALDDLGLTGGIKHGDACGFFIFCDLPHGIHTFCEQLCHLCVDLVDTLPREQQCVLL